MVYGRSKPVPPPATPFEEFMATASERMTAARLEGGRRREGRGRHGQSRSRGGHEGRRLCSNQPVDNAVVASMAWGGRGDSYLVPHRSTRPRPPPRSKAPRRSTRRRASSVSTRRRSRWRSSTRPPSSRRARSPRPPRRTRSRRPWGRRSRSRRHPPKSIE